MLFPQFAVNFQNSENKHHFGSLPILQEIESQCGLLHQLGKQFSHLERCSESKQPKHHNFKPDSLIRRDLIDLLYSSFNLHQILHSFRKLKEIIMG